ncbi:MAG: DUF1501 domain-containing protein [Planctomycetes bacterium]|nr:DUF1501 domain-containing protein [Planctomycetota bacterium]
MLNFHSRKPVQFCDGLTRRDFMRVGTLSAGAVGLTLADSLRLQAETKTPSSDINCIMLFLVGGPSHLDTWDLKPDAPENIRGPFRPIRTNVPGIDICEHFPLMSRSADRFALLRSVHHQAAPIHETGHQLMQTGYLSRGGVEHPHFGSVVSHLKGQTSAEMPASVVLPRPIGYTGVSVGHGQASGYLGAKHEPFVFEGTDPERLQSRDELIQCVDDAQRVFETRHLNDAAQVKAFGSFFSPQAKSSFDITAEKETLRNRYGRNTFGQGCLLARRLVENGVRFVTVNMFDTVFDNVTWDCHADGGSLASTLNDYKETLCPMFDLAYTALLEDLAQRGMLENTLVVAMGEFGRTPLLNARGGRDHYPGVWSILFAGANVATGQVIGSSDKHGANPQDRPITPPEVAASVYKGLGLDLDAQLPSPDNRPVPMVEANPIAGLFK